MMSVVRTRRSRASARTLTALVFALAALLAGCSTHSSASPGTPVVTLSDTSGDFAAYRVGLGFITLTDTRGATVSPIPQMPAESVDLAALTDLTELLGVQAAPAGTYKSATLTLDYTSASIWVNLNGQAVAATPVNSAGSALSTATVTVT